jgi:flagellar hook-associated protein 1 FlgK
MIRGTFFGIEVAKKGLLASQAALDTTSHNIANANTEGYSRQRVNLRASPPIAYPGAFITLRPGQLGTGVEVYSITRIRSDLVEAQIHSGTGDQQMLSVMQDSFTRVQDILGEPSDHGIGALMEGFFSAWEELSNDPESASTRTNLREAAQALTDFTNEADFKLKQEITNLNNEIDDRVLRLNSLATQIADVNQQIIRIEGTGEGNTIKANDLKDQRDALVEEMSGLINARVQFDRNGGITVLIQGHPIVLGQYAEQIGTRFNPADPTKPIIEFTKSRIPLSITSGEIAGLQQMRDEEIPAVRSQLEQLLSAFTNRVNVVHEAGYGLDGNKGRPFFMDNEFRRVEGSIALPPTTTLDTTLDVLGITSGDFFVQGKRVVIADKEVMPGTALTLRQLLDRINAQSVDIRAQLDTSLGFSRIIISQYNPPDNETPLTINDGTSNFFEVVGLKDAPVKDLGTEPPYQNSLYNLKINPAILNNLDAIAAAGDDGLGFPGPGDNRTALAIADLKNDNQALFGTSFDEYYQGAVATLGSAAQNTERSYESQQLVVQQLDAKRQEISGVNLDEEAVNLIRFQRSYEASARALTIIDEVINLIVNRLGISGR